MKRILAGAVLVLSVTTVSAGFEEGVVAYNQGDYATAMAEWRPLADKGVASAQYNIGLMYMNGQGVDKDIVTAVNWMRKAAEGGDRDAQLAVGLMYRKGQGIPQDDFEAVNWFRAAAEQGNTDAALQLAMAYQEGRGTVLNNEQASQWFSHAAENQNAEAQYWLGRNLLFGKGVERDPVRGYACLSLAAAALVKDATKLRDFAREQLNYDQVIEAQELSREMWEEYGPKPKN